MNKKWISSILAASVLSSPIIMPTKGSAAASFIDIDGSYAKNAIVELFDQKIVTGVDDSNFYPTRNITRQDFAIILAKTLKLDISNPPTTPTFQDVPPSNYAYSYVEAAVKAGLIKGTGNHLFGAGSHLSRQDMVVMFVRALGIDPSGKAKGLQFADSSQISEYSKDYIAAAVEYGLINGFNNFFDPVVNVDRQAVALVASKFLKYKESQNNTEQPSPSPTAQPVIKPVTTPSPAPATSTGGTSSSQSDTSAPITDVTKFEVIDNYNGTPDQIRGLAGAIGEQGSVIQAYLWTDANENNVVDAGELGPAIVLGTSEVDGSMSPVSIGDLSAGTYRFVITAKDSANNESAKDAAHAVTVTLDKNEVPDTSAPSVDLSKFEIIDNYNGTPDQVRALAGAIGEQGALVQAYLWTDTNENGVVDADELGAAIPLGTSEADGSMKAFDISDLRAGTYRFVITVKDAANNESAKDAAHAVTVTLEKNEVPDTTAPSVDSSKFEVIDNYNGTPDQIRGIAGAIGEQGSIIQAYPWIDANQDNVVDASELGAAITLGVSEADGSVNAASIGDLKAGIYRFVITAKDAADNESAKDAAHAITIELVKGAFSKPTVTSDIYGFDGSGPKTKQFITGSTPSMIRFDFFSGEKFTNAEVQVTMEGLTFTTDDYYSIEGWTHPTSDQISNNGHTLTFTGSASSTSDLSFELHNKKMPAPGTYLIKFKADADGPGTARTYSEEQVIFLIILPPA